MIKTIPTLQAPSHDEYAIVAKFSETSLATLSTLQNQLVDILGDAIWLTPQRALHSTLIEIICDVDYGVSSRKQLFDNWHEQYNQIVAENISEMSPFAITFDKLEISQNAIIVKASDSTIFNDARFKLLSVMNLPTGTKQPPDITHCTLARYNDAIKLNDVIEQTKMLRINFTEHVVRFELLKDLGPPNFQPKPVNEYQFQNFGMINL